MTFATQSLGDAAANKRAKPIKKCLGCGCGIRTALRCGPCSADHREALARARSIAKKAQRLAARQQA